VMAFHNDPAIKKKYLARVRAHRKADEIVKGQFWEKGKGCAIGCTIHSSIHSDYETELGIPEWVAHVEDVIFEGLPNKRAKLWPEEFLSAIPVGADLNGVNSPFIVFVLRSTLDKFDHDKFPKVKTCVGAVIELYETKVVDLAKFHSMAAASAAAASWAAWAAAKSAGEAGAWAAKSAASAAAWAAWAAAKSAGEAAAWAARAAAKSAGEAGEAAAAQYQVFAAELLRLLKDTI
jgi:hypothetical protein